jgi:long-chain acyl-CoA synthetase
MMTTTTIEATNAAVKPKRVPLFENEPQTLAEVFLKAAKEFDKPDALNCKKGDAWIPISSKEMIARSRAIALGLYSLGIRKGDRIALLSSNCPEWTLTDAGCQFAGVIDVPIYTTQAAPQVAYILDDSGSRIFFLENKRAYDRIKEAIQDCASVEMFVFFDATGVEEKHAVSLAQLEDIGRELEKEQPTLADELTRAVKSDDLATIIYTSGTTGEPKGVMLTHSNLVSNMIDCSEGFVFTREDASLSVLPLSHVFERNGMYMYIHHGMSVYYAESIEKIGQNLREVNPTIFVSVPRIFEKIYARAKEKAFEAGKSKASIFVWSMNVGKEYARRLQHKEKIPFGLKLKYKIADTLVFKKWREALGGRIRLFISGGAALSEDIGLIFLGAGLMISQGYGLTETSPVITSSPPDGSRVGTVGKPIRNVEVRIAADGEIEARGPNIMRGYYNKPEATQDVFTEDGWFKTGDIGVIDSEGYLRITDRKKELFKTSGGKYIAPAPIEQLIKASRFVNQVVLIGNERKFPAALIVPNFEQLHSYAKEKNITASTKEELCQHAHVIELIQKQVDSLTPDLAKYEKVKRVALLEEELTIEGGELTPTLKIKRRIVDEKYKEIIDRIYDETETSYQK